MQLLDTENADRNLTAAVTVLTDTPAVRTTCRVRVDLGDGAKNLTATGGAFELTILVGGQTWNGGPETIICGGAVRSTLRSQDFEVEAGEQVLVKVKSPNAGDTDVDVTARLYDVTVPGATELHLVKAMLANKHLHTVATGVDVVKDDDGSTTLHTYTPSEAAGVVTLTPS